MEQRVRRLFFITTWAAVGWHFLYGAVLTTLLDREYATAWFNRIYFYVGTLLALAVGGAGLSGLLGKYISIRWRQGFWTVRRVRFWLGLFLALDVVFLVLVLYFRYLVLNLVLKVPAGLQIAGEVGMPAGGILVLLTGLIWSFRRRHRQWGNTTVNE